MRRSLWWINGQGMAQCDGVSMRLTQPPRLPGVAVHEIEYIPQVKSWWLCYVNGVLVYREMADGERELLDRLLERMHDAAVQVFA
jgi:hypothetical protein